MPMIEGYKSPNQKNSDQKKGLDRASDKKTKTYPIQCANATYGGYLVKLDDKSLASSITLIPGLYSALCTTVPPTPYSFPATQTSSALLSFNTDLSDPHPIQERVRNDYYPTFEENQVIDEICESLSAHKKQQSPMLVVHSQQDTVDVKSSQAGQLASYIGKGRASMDVGNVRSNLSWKSTKRFHYFEVTIESTASRGNIYIGLSDPKFSWSKNLGFFPNSFAYRSEDGKKVHEKGIQEAYGPPILQGSVVGCGLDTCLQQIFYTIDGKYLGTAFENVPLFDYYPSVTMHAFGEAVKFNFSHPFVFDLYSFEKEQTVELKNSITSIANLIDYHAEEQMIVQYLIFYGYESTLKSLNLPHLYLSDPEWKSLYSTLETRSNIRQSILHGDIEKAIQMVCQYFSPELSVANESDYVSHIPHQLWFPLKCQQWIEIVREGDGEKIFSFLKDGFSSLKSLVREEAEFLEACIALVAYEQPNTCPWSWLLEQEQRDHIADIVNVYLILFGLCCHSREISTLSLTCQVSKLEIALRQLIQCLRVLNQSSRRAKGSIFYSSPSNNGISDESHIEDDIRRTHEPNPSSIAGLEPFVKLLCSL